MLRDKNVLVHQSSPFLANQNQISLNDNQTELLFTQQLDTQVTSCKKQINDISNMKADLQLKIIILRGVKQTIKNALTQKQNISKIKRVNSNCTSIFDKISTSNENNLNLFQKEETVIMQQEASTIITPPKNRKHEEIFISCDFQSPSKLNDQQNSRSQIKTPMNISNRVGSLQSMIEEFLQFRKYYRAIRLICYERFEELENYRRMVREGMIKDTEHSFHSPFNESTEEQHFLCIEDLNESPTSVIIKSSKIEKIERYKLFLSYFEQDIYCMRNLVMQLNQTLSLIEEDLKIITNKICTSNKYLQDCFFRENQKSYRLQKLTVISHNLQFQMYGSKFFSPLRQQANHQNYQNKLSQQQTPPKKVGKRDDNELVFHKNNSSQESVKLTYNNTPQTNQNNQNSFQSPFNKIQSNQFNSSNNSNNRNSSITTPQKKKSSLGCFIRLAASENGASVLNQFYTSNKQSPFVSAFK